MSARSTVSLPRASALARSPVAPSVPGQDHHAQRVVEHAGLLGVDGDVVAEAAAGEQAQRALAAATCRPSGREAVSCSMRQPIAGSSGAQGRACAARGRWRRPARCRRPGRACRRGRAAGACRTGRAPPAASPASWVPPRAASCATFARSTGPAILPLRLALSLSAKAGGSEGEGGGQAGARRQWLRCRDPVSERSASSRPPRKVPASVPSSLTLAAGSSATLATEASSAISGARAGAGESEPAPGRCRPAPGRRSAPGPRAAAWPGSARRATRDGPSSQLALQPRRAELEVEPVDVQGVAVERHGRRLHQAQGLARELARRPWLTRTVLRGAQDVERRGRRSGRTAGRPGCRRRWPRRRAPRAGRRRSSAASATARSGAANPSARRLASTPPRPRASVRVAASVALTQAAEIAAEAGRVELEGGVLAILRGGEPQVELGAAAELLPGPGLQGGEVARLARQLAAHQRAASATSASPASRVAGAFSVRPVSVSRSPASR